MRRCGASLASGVRTFCWRSRLLDAEEAAAASEDTGVLTLGPAVVVLVLVVAEDEEDEAALAATVLAATVLAAAALPALCSTALRESGSESESEERGVFWEVSRWYCNLELERGVLGVLIVDGVVLSGLRAESLRALAVRLRWPLAEGDFWRLLLLLLLFFFPLSLARSGVKD